MESVITYKSNWWGYIGKRVTITVVAFFVASMLLFFTPRLINGQGVEYYTSTGGAIIDFGSREAAEQFFKEQRILHHFDDPMIVQYMRWMGDFFTGFRDQPLVNSSYYSK